MSISRESLKGYLLEEALAYLIMHTGYRLLSDESDDREDLTNTRSGLAVKGRGANHQVDVLGQLRWIPTFTHPLRLFVEAKFRGEARPVGLSTVRNAVGVIDDISQRNLPDRHQKPPKQRFRYVYSLFSTSGFTTDAQDMALAHQISLVDLGGKEYDALRNGINLAGDSLPIEGQRGKIVFNLRHAIRRELSTVSLQSLTRAEHRNSFDRELVQHFLPTVRELAASVREFGELFVGMAEGPFMLLLKETTRGQFLAYAEENPRHEVTINWTTAYARGRVWIIKPVRDPPRYSLEFRIPKVLEEWIYQTSTDPRGRALDAKEGYFSTITVYRSGEAGDRLFTLEFNAVESLRNSSYGQQSL